jgi:hypothetical protein
MRAKGKNKFISDLLSSLFSANITHNNQKGAKHMAQVNYSAEMTAQIISDYQNGVAVEDIASSIEKSVRSVRSKLVREGVYVAQPKAKANKVQGPTKKELLNDLEATGFDVSGFEGATKDAIMRLIAMQ